MPGRGRDAGLGGERGRLRRRRRPGQRQAHLRPALGQGPHVRRGEAAARHVLTLGGSATTSPTGSCLAIRTIRFPYASRLGATLMRGDEIGPSLANLHAASSGVTLTLLVFLARATETRVVATRLPGRRPRFPRELMQSLLMGSEVFCLKEAEVFVGFLVGSLLLRGPVAGGNSVRRAYRLKAS